MDAGAAMNDTLFDVGDAREWTLTIPAPCAWLTANQLNNRHNRFKRADLTRHWRTAGWGAAKMADLPIGLHCIEVLGVARFLGRAPVRDRDNLRPTLKAVIDGLGPARTFNRQGKIYHSSGYGLIADDDDKHLLRSDIRIGDPLPKHSTLPGHLGLLMLTIQEIPR